jgi:hypothetical protein
MSLLSASRPPLGSQVAYAILRPCAFIVLSLFACAPVLASAEGAIVSEPTAYQTPANQESGAARRARNVQQFDIDGDGVIDLVLPAARCNEGTFMPTVCWGEVPDTVKYRPSYEACGGDAAILLSGPFANAYSVVLRDVMNRDRFPPCSRSGSNYNGCSFQQCNTLGLNRCSAFKCQRVFKTGSGRRREQVCCLGDSGNSSVLSKATRMTIKLRDVPGSNSDPLVRLALKRNNPRLRLN